MRARVGVLLTIALVAGACSDGDEPLVAREIVSDIPWTAPETARYRITQGDDIEGSGVLSIEEDERNSQFVFRQDFEGEGFTDTIGASVDATTLKPFAVDRLVEGPEGPRHCFAQYEDSVVTIQDQSDQDERDDEIDVPMPSYDSWTDLFLWRTLPLGEGYETRYVEALVCKLNVPEVVGARVRVRELEEVEVPAGTFQAWRVEIRSKGDTQKAWIADDDARTLVRYDNGFQLFELESIE